MAFQPRVVDPGYGRMPRQELCHLLGVVAVPLHPQSQGLQALEKQKGIEWAQAGPKVSKKLKPDFIGKCGIADSGNISKPLPVL